MDFCIDPESSGLRAWQFGMKCPLTCVEVLEPNNSCSISQTGNLWRESTHVLRHQEMHVVIEDNFLLPWRRWGDRFDAAQKNSALQECRKSSSVQTATIYVCLLNRRTRISACSLWPANPSMAQ